MIQFVEHYQMMGLNVQGMDEHKIRVIKDSI